MSIIASERNGPLCPQSGTPFLNELHAFKNRMINTLDNASEHLRDEDGELPEDIDRAHDALSRGTLSDFMRLYVAEGAPEPATPGGGSAISGGVRSVAGYYWQCQVCGFTLPATEIRRGG